MEWNSLPFLVVGINKTKQRNDVPSVTGKRLFGSYRRCCDGSLFLISISVRSLTSLTVLTRKVRKRKLFESSSATEFNEFNRKVEFRVNFQNPAQMRQVEFGPLDN